MSARKKKTEFALLKEELWELCRKIVLKLYGNTCYTCDAENLEGRNCQTGHFITDATCSIELSYDLNNLRIQCFSCNIWKSGYWVEFEKRMIKEKGIEFVEEMKVRNDKTMKEEKNRKNKEVIVWYKQKVQEYKLILEQL